MIPEAAIEIQSQLAFISAVLAGFAITLAVGLLQLNIPHRRGQRILVWATGLAMLSGIVLLVATVAGAFGAVWMAERINMGPQPNTPAPLLTAFRWAVTGFVVGVCTLMASLGVSGWIRSRSLGWGTSLCASAATAMILYFLLVVVDVD